MKLGRHFTLAEMTRSETAEKRNIPNVPSAKELANLSALVQNVLDPLREAVGKPVKVTSGYRSPAVNKAVGGVATSQHVKGQAADVQVSGISPGKLIELMRKHRIQFDQAIDEYDSWLHVSWRENPRGEALKYRKVGSSTTKSKV